MLSTPASQQNMSVARVRVQAGEAAVSAVDVDCIRWVLRTKNTSPLRLEPSQRAAALDEHQDFLTAEVLNTKGFHNT